MSVTASCESCKTEYLVVRIVITAAELDEEDGVYKLNNYTSRRHIARWASLPGLREAIPELQNEWLIKSYHDWGIRIDEHDFGPVALDGGWYVGPVPYLVWMERLTSEVYPALRDLAATTLPVPDPTVLQKYGREPDYSAYSSEGTEEDKEKERNAFYGFAPGREYLEHIAHQEILDEISCEDYEREQANEGQYPS